MAKILFYSPSGDLAALVPRVDGELLLVRPLAKKKGLYAGLAPIVGSLEEGIQHRPEAIMFDMVGSRTLKIGETADRLRRRFPVWGAGAVNDLIELDRGFAMSVATECGIKIPKSIIFDPARGRSWESIDPEDRSRVERVKGHIPEARQFLKAVGGRYVVKPFDNASTSLSYVSDDVEDLDHRLAEAQEKHEVLPTSPIMLQAYVGGVEISTELPIVNGEPVYPGNSTIEVKKLLAGDLGPNTGCQTSTCFVYDKPFPKILRQTMGRPDFLAWLKKPTGPRGESYPPFHGFLDINCIIDEETHKAHMLEFTPRFGYNAIYALSRLIDDDLHDVLVGAARGELSKIHYRPGYSYAIRCTVKPYPIADAFEYHANPKDDKERRENATLEDLLVMATHVSIRGPVEDDSVFLLDAQKVNGKLRTAGFDGVVLEVTGTGQTIEEARDPAHAMVKEIDVPDLMARIGDGANRAISAMAKLAAWGFETPETMKIVPQVKEEEKPKGIPTEPRAQEQALRAMATLGAGSVPPGGPAGRPGVPGSHMVAGQASPTAAGAAAHQAASSGADSGGVSGSGAKSVAG